MNARIAALIFTLITGAGAAQRPPLTTVMYMTNRPTAIASFLEHWNGVSIIAPQCFAMDAQGFVAGEVPPAVLETARQHRIAIMPLVTNKGFNQPLVHSVLDSPEARARAIRYLIYYALRDGYIGIQFDYENIKYTYRDRFSDFFHQAAVEFHKRGLLLTAAVVGKYSDDRNAESPGGYDDWSGVYDYPRLAGDADFLSIMAYPQHGAFSSPGPLAGLPWVRQIVAFTRSQMPLGKISLGVPLYGFHWVTDPSAKRTGRSSVYKDTAAILAQNRAEWREEEQAYRTVFDDSAGRHEVWYEDARSVGAKLQLAASERLAGISAWALGQEDPGVWEALARDYRIVRPRTRIPKGTFAERSKGAARRL